MTNTIKIKLILFVILLMLSTFAYSQDIKIHYPDTKIPKTKPIVFANELVSSEEHEFGCCFSSDGTEFYFTRAIGNFKKKNILVIKFDGKNWTQPQKALPDFNGETYEPHISADGKKLYFMGMVQNDKKNAKHKMTMDLYYAEKNNDQWSKIVHLEDPFNPLKSMYISTTVDGLLFTTNRSGDGPDIVYVKDKKGKYSNYSDPGSTINTDHSELYPFVARDGSYLLFNRIVDRGKFMFVCFRQNDGSWGNSLKVPLGMESGCPMVSPDNKFLFFNSGEKFSNDIFWVSSDIFLKLKPESQRDKTQE